MTDTDPTFSNLNPQVVSDNIAHIKGMIRRIRQNEGGIGSQEDEMSLHRVVEDLVFLIDMLAKSKTSYAKLQTEFASMATAAVSQQTTVYEEQIAALNARIKELEDRD